MAVNDWVEVEEKDDWEEVSTESPSMLESGAAGFKQGATFGFEDELGGFLEAVGSTLGIKGLGQSFSDMGVEKPYWLDESKTLGDVYKRARDKRRAYNQLQKETNPGSFLTGELASAAIPLGAPGKIGQAGAKAFGLGGNLPGKVVSGGIQGMAEGALAGAGVSEDGIVDDISSGAVLGGLTGSVLPMGIEAGKAGMKALGKGAKKAKEGISDSIYSLATREQKEDLFNRYKQGDFDENLKMQDVWKKLDDQVTVLDNEIVEMNKEVGKTLRDPIFDTELKEIKKAFDDQYSEMVDELTDKETIRAINSAKENFDIWTDNAFIRKNQIKEDLSGLNDEIDIKREELYSLKDLPLDTDDFEINTKVNKLVKDIQGLNKRKMDYANELVDMNKQIKEGALDPDALTGQKVFSFNEKIRSKIKDWRDNINQTTPDKIKQRYMKGVQGKIDKGLLKNLERVEDPKYGYTYKQKEGIPEMPNYGIYRDQMEELSSKKRAQELLEDFLGISKKSESSGESVPNKIRSISSGEVDPQMKKTYTSMMSEVDEGTQMEFMRLIKDLGLNEAFEGQMHKGVTRGLETMKANAIDKLVGKGMKKAIKTQAKMSNAKSKVLEKMSTGRLKELGKYAPEFIRAFQEGGVPRVIALEFKLQQQDPEFFNEE